MQPFVDSKLFSKYQEILVLQSSCIRALPTGQDWYLKVIHMPKNYAETIWDISFVKNQAQLQLTRYLSSLWTALNNSSDSRPLIHPRMEVSEGNLSLHDFSILEVKKGIARNCIHQSFEKKEEDQYKILFFDQNGPYEADITAPYQRKDCEEWQRLLNRLIGSGLSIPRRFVAA